MKTLNEMNLFLYVFSLGAFSIHTHRAGIWDYTLGQADPFDVVTCACMLKYEELSRG